MGNTDAAEVNLGVLAQPSRDDVRSAFRLILGREIEDEATIQAHLAIPTIAELRVALLSSPEFRGKFRAMHPDVYDHPGLSQERPTVAFIHLQKTGGTTLRELITGYFPPERRCPIFEDKLHVLSAAELSRYDFFAGHFDVATLRFIPRDKIQVIGLFREPQARLISFYRFLKSHPRTDEFSSNMLVQLAHDHDPEDFFSLPLIRANPGFFNHYLFAFGKSFIWFVQNQNGLTHEVLQTILSDAKLQIRSMKALGITERFSDSVSLICSSLGVRPPNEIRKIHVTDEFAASDSRFQRVAAVAVTPKLVEILHDLIKYDRALYEFAVSEFERRLVGLKTS